MDLKAALERVEDIIGDHSYIGNSCAEGDDVKRVLLQEMRLLVDEIYRRNQFNPVIVSGPSLNQSTAVPLDAMLYSLQPGDGSTYNFALWPTPKSVPGCKSGSYFTLVIFGYDGGCGEVAITEDFQYVGYLQGHGFPRTHSSVLAKCLVAARCIAHDRPLVEVLSLMADVNSRLVDGRIDLRGL